MSRNLSLKSADNLGLKVWDIRSGTLWRIDRVDWGRKCIVVTALEPITGVSLEETITWDLVELLTDLAAKDCEIYLKTYNGLQPPDSTPLYLA